MEADKEYTIRFVFLRDEDRDENNQDISFGHLGDDGSIGWFETKVKAGPKSKGEVRFTSKGQISVDKRGNFSFTKKPTFQNEDLLGNDWEVDIGLVEGISWEHDGRRTKWHTIRSPIPSNELYDTINLYDSKYYDGGESSIDFICVRPIMNYKHPDGKTYKYQWDSFVEDIYYPPMNPDFMHGIYFEFEKSEIPAKDKYSRCDVTIDGIGKVSEMIYVDEITNKGYFFYPFAEPGKKYTVRFSFKKHEKDNSEGFIIYTPENDTLVELERTATVGAKSKGEVRLNGNKWIHADSNYNIDYFTSPVFKNEELLTGENYNWEMEMGLVEGISWEHGEQRRTKWHCSIHIPKNDLYNYNATPINLRNLSDLHDPDGKTCENHEHEIDFICVRPIMFYEYDGKEYKYMWDGYVQDIHPPTNPNERDGIYFEFEKSEIPAKDKYSRCDVTIVGIGRVSEMIYVDESTNKGYFFYPFVEPNKEYTVIFSFKKIENVDKEGFTIPTPDDTIKEVKMNVTAGPRAKGEVIPSDKWAMGVDNDYNIHTFEKFEAENEHLFEGKWEVEIGLMEGISWDHGDERRTKWHCAVYIPNESIHGNSVNLRELCKQQNQHEPHEIDCICVRPIMRYTQDDKEYKYQWVGFTYDIHYPLNTQLIDINNPDDIAKIIGTWKQNEEWDDTEHYPVMVHVVWNETLVIDGSNVKTNSSWKYTKLNNTAFTKEELADMVHYSEPWSDLIPSSEVDAFEKELNKDTNVLKFEKHIAYYEQEEPYYQYYIYKLDDEHYILSNNSKTLTEKYDNELPISLSDYFKDQDDINDKGYTRYHELKLFKHGSELQVLTYGTDEDGYYEWTDVYKRQ